jgi:hypothetical protein
MTRGERKRLLRSATRERIALEREALASMRSITARPADVSHLRLEEGEALEMLNSVPSVFGIARKMNRDYDPSEWASQRYGGK